VVNNPDRDAAMAAEGGWADAPFPKKATLTPAAVPAGKDGVVLMKQLKAAFDEVDQKFKAQESRIDYLESKVAFMSTQIADLDGLVNESLAEKTAPDAASKKSTK